MQFKKVSDIFFYAENNKKFTDLSTAFNSSSGYMPKSFSKNIKNSIAKMNISDQYSDSNEIPYSDVPYLLKQDSIFNENQNLYLLDPFTLFNFLSNFSCTVYKETIDHLPLPAHLTSSTELHVFSENWLNFATDSDKILKIENKKKLLWMNPFSMGIKNRDIFEKLKHFDYILLPSPIGLLTETLLISTKKLDLQSKYSPYWLKLFSQYCANYHRQNNVHHRKKITDILINYFEKLKNKKIIKIIQQHSIYFKIELYKPLIIEKSKNYFGRYFYNDITFLGDSLHIYISIPATTLEHHLQSKLIKISELLSGNLKIN